MCDLPSAKEGMLSPAFICLFATLLKKFLVDFDEILRKCLQWDREQIIRMCGDPDHHLDLGIFLSILYRMEMLSI